MPTQKKKTVAAVRKNPVKRAVKAVKPGWLDGGVTEFIRLAVIFLLPITFWPGAYTSFELPKVVLFRTLTFMLLVSFIFRLVRKYRASATAPAAYKGRNPAILLPAAGRLKWPLILLGLTVLTWILSTILSPAPAISFFGYYPRFQGLYTWINYLIFGAVVFLGIENRKQVERIFGLIAVSALLTAVLAFLQSRGAAWLNYWDVSNFLGRFFGTMGHPDYLAGLLVMTIPLLAAMLCVKKTRLTGGAALVFSLSALYFTFSRAAYLGLFAALFVLLLAAARKLNWKKMFWTVLVTPVVLAACVLAVNIFQQNDFVNSNALLSRLVLQGENLRSVQTRLVLWPATLSQILHSPLAGYGLDTYAITFPAYAPIELNTLENMGDYPDRAHNLVLDYAVQSGIPGLVIFAAFLLLIFIRGFRAVFTRQKDWLFPLAILASLSGILVTNLFGFFITVTWVYFWLLVAVLFNLILPKKEYSYGFLNRKYAGKLLIGTIICAGLINVVTQDFLLFAADINYREAAMTGNLAAAANASSKAPQISFYSLQQANLLIDAAKRAENGQRAENSQIDPTNSAGAAGAETKAPQSARDLYLSALAPLEQAGRLTSKDGFYYLYKGIIAAATPCVTQSAGLCDPSDRFFTLAAQKMPAYPAVQLESGKALLKEKRYAEAADALEKYLALGPPYYLWKGNLGTHTPEEQERFRIFYKLNPDFDAVFVLLEEAYAKSGDLHKAAEYGGYLYY